MASNWRWLDAVLSCGIISIVFASGVFYQRLDDLENCLIKRGCVPISIEADQRITKIETRLSSLESDIVRRLERIEKQLDR